MSGPIDDIGGPLMTPGQREARHRLATTEELHLPLLGGPAQGRVLTRERGRPWREGETVRVPVTRDVMVATFGVRDSRPVPIAFTDESYMVHATTSGRLIGLHVGSLPELLHEPAWRVNAAFNGVECHCHASIAEHRVEVRVVACGQCGHDPKLHKDSPGVGCAATGCLCLNTPTLATR